MEILVYRFLIKKYKNKNTEFIREVLKKRREREKNKNNHLLVGIYRLYYIKKIRKKKKKPLIYNLLLKYNKPRKL
jgi:hypothetical protein